jgi:hypothetical protein
MNKIFVSVDDKRFEATGDLLDQLNTEMAQMTANRIALENRVAATELAKESAIIKLTALGLTEQEAKAVIGIG